jgi:hypothetical protein
MKLYKVISETNRLYCRMERVIEVRFISDGLVTEAEKLPYIRYINRVLSGFMEDIIYARGHVHVSNAFAKEMTPR